MPSPVLSDVEIQATKLMREHADDFFHTYWRAHNREPNDAKIMIHMEYLGRSDVVSWIKLDGHFKVDELS